MIRIGLDLYKIFVGAGVSATLALLTFIGNGVVNNEVRNVTQHREIRKEMLSADKDISNSLDRVKDIVTDIRLEQVDQRAILKQIEKKL